MTDALLKNSEVPLFIVPPEEDDADDDADE